MRDEEKEILTVPLLLDYNENYTLFQDKYMDECVSKHLRTAKCAFHRYKQICALCMCATSNIVPGDTSKLLDTSEIHNGGPVAGELRVMQSCIKASFYKLSTVCSRAEKQPISLHFSWQSFLKSSKPWEGKTDA